MPQSTMFRKKALDQLSSPEQLDALMVVTSRRGWLALVGLMLLIVGLVVWSVIGVVPTRVDAQGVFIRTGGVQPVTVTTAGRVSDLSVGVGDQIHQGQIVARLSQPALLAQMRAQQTRVDSLTRQQEQLRRHHDQQRALQSAFIDQRRANLEELLAINQERYQIETQLEEKGLIPRRDRIETEREIADTRADLKALALGDAQREQDRVNRLETARLALDQARSELERLVSRYRNSVQVLSPHTGRVVEVKHNTGAAVSAGAELLSMERTGRDIKRLEVAMFIPASDGKQLEPGMTALISPAAIRREEHGYLVGRITRVSDYPVTFNGLMRLLDNESLVRGLMAEGSVFEAQVDLIPDAATPSGFRWTSGKGPDEVIRSGGMATVRVTVAERRPITLVIPALRRWLGLSA
ncbi:NHLP bacteriocin system secretion protein [Spiribacter roseus]|uniref:NHLP bacteriocin system secretion protein n=1 Tax=Spiribacter roseus TaxID=1855875 RepID=UPI0013305CC2|nr:NHLP bacteriocin system secretion protein [Spiribacter roseus]